MSENNYKEKPAGNATGQNKGGQRGFPKKGNDKRGYQGKKPYSPPAVKGRSGERKFAQPAFGKPVSSQGLSSQGERKPYGRPAPQGPSGERSFGKPANQSSAPAGERKSYGRPAPQGQSGERRFGKPANHSSAPAGEHKAYGRPVPQGQGGERSFGKPAYQTSAPAGERKAYGRPAPQGQSGERSFSKPAYQTSAPAGERKPFGRPAPQGQSGERSFTKPAYQTSAPAGERKPYGRSAPQSQSGERSFVKPAYQTSAPAGERKPYGRPASQGSGNGRGFRQSSFNRAVPSGSFGRDTYGSNDRPIQNQQHFGKPAMNETGKLEKRPESKPAQSRFARPGAPRPSFNRSAPSRTDFRRGASFPASPKGEGSLSVDARKSAMLVLNRVLLESGYASLSLDEHFEQVNLSQRDKRFCTRIVYLTLENLNRIDFALNQLLEAPERVDKRVRIILRLSAAQILLLDRVPDSAAVNEAVKLVRDLGLEDLTGLVNGVLRNLIRTKDEFKYPTKEDGLTYYHIMNSLPIWYIEKIMEEYGEEEGEKILSYRKSDHHMTIRFNSLRINEKQFEELLSKKTWESKKGLMPGAYYVTGVSDIASDSDYADGLFSIQGEGSMMAAEAVQPKLGAQVLDTCAAPGGKTAYLAEKMQGTGRVQAWDIYEHRVELIKSMAERLRHYNIRPAVRDALVYREQLEGLMDAVLIDAPCTGTGVMDEKPDLRHHLNEESLKDMTDIQTRLLDTCSRYVKPGGTLVYSTCSILKEENQAQVEAFLENHPEFSVMALSDTIPQNLREQAGPLGLQLLPYRDGVEGFFISRMKRA